MNKFIVVSVLCVLFLTQDQFMALKGQLATVNYKMGRQLESGQEYNYPLKTAAYWTRPIMTRSDAQNLAKHDLVIVDLENKFNNRQILLELKELNPAIKILAYSNPMEIFLTTYSDRPWQNKVISEITTNRKEWLLKTIKIENGVRQQNYAEFWLNMVMINMSSTCVKVKGQTYSQWMAAKIQEEVLSDKIFDGYFMDNGTINISWICKNSNEKIDIDDDLRADTDLNVDRKWSRGVSEYISHIRYDGEYKNGILNWFFNLFAIKNDLIIISNKGDLNLLKQVDGKMFENFPNDYLGETWANGWRQSISNAKKTGEYTIIKVERGSLQFGLASSLLLDNVYFAVGQDDAGIFPEFYLKTGKPLGHIKTRNGIYTREYEKVTVTVDPLNKKGVITKK